MIDLHCHILPGVDDGSEDLTTSLDMAAMAAGSGVHAIVATPHCNIPGLRPNYADRALYDAVRALRGAVQDAGIALQIYAGAEIFFTPEVPLLLENRWLPTLNGSRYLLVEFPFDAPEEYMTRGLEEIKAAELTPIVAHPERYFAVQLEPGIFIDWFQRGFALQLNKDSILGRLGSRAERAAQWALRRGLAHVVASDAHGVRVRNPSMDTLREELAENYSEEYARLLLEENPRRILSGRSLSGV